MVQHVAGSKIKNTSIAVWYNVTSNATKKLCRATKTVALPGIQLVKRHRVDACDISTSACDKVRLIQVGRQNHILYHILNIARHDTFKYIHSEGIL